MKISVKQLLARHEKLLSENFTPEFYDDAGASLRGTTKHYNELFAELFCITDNLEKEIKKLKKLLEEKRMTPPKFKIGDTIFFIGTGDIQEIKIDKIRIELTAKRQRIEYHEKGCYVTEADAFRDTYEIYEYIEKKIKKTEVKK
jgi:hypothetical protein